MPHAERCANPMRTPGEKGHTGKGLRFVLEILRQKWPFLSANAKLCNNCRKRASTHIAGSLPSEPSPNKEVSPPLSSHSTDRPCNAILFATEIRVDNITENSLRSGHSFHSIDPNRNVFLNEASEESDAPTPVDDSETECHWDRPENFRSSRELELEQMLDGIKEKFNRTTKYSERIQILTVVPPSWSVRKVSREFGTTRYMAKKAKQLRKKGGVFASTVAKAGKTLPKATVEKVRNFYESNSRVMPGMKDKISVRINDVKRIMQKRMILHNLNDLHEKYKVAHSESPVWFSKFAELRLKHCVLAGASGTHVVCVCTYHQNCNLMLDAINISTLTANSTCPLVNYKDCLTRLMCSNPTPECYLDECKNCPGIEALSLELKELLHEAVIDTVEFKTWQSVDRTTLQTQRLTVCEFVDALCERLKVLKPHHFIAKQQNAFVKERKENLIDGEILVQCDFSENYAFVAQDAAQSFHYNNDQCTVHPVVYYYCHGNDIRHRSLVLLSDSLVHDTTAVYLMQQILIQHIKQVCNVVNKLIYVTDGAAQHYKNRYNIANLLFHEKDFEVDAEAHYHATSHGKTACDGIGAVLKREARRRSLQIINGEPILTPDALFQWAKNNFKDLDMFFYSKQEHEDMKDHLKIRLDGAKAISAIQKNHGFIPREGKELLIKRYSSATGGEVFPKKKQRNGRRTSK